jgi:benzoyl-CoA reductase/2-hydroxyglutaryl-CoA dehydratase subunit BcrC/BadD/HgdB
MQVFYSSPWVPPEWIKAHGLEPRGVWLAGDSRPLALAAGVCAFAESVVRLAEAHPASAMIFSTHCDQMRRGYDVVAGAAPGRVFLFNLPATWQTAVAGKMFASELERLGRFLVTLGGQPPTAEGLEEAMRQYRMARSQLLDAAAQLPARRYCEAVARFHWDGSVNLPEGWRGPGTDAIPVAVVGGPLPAWQGQVLDAVESAGGRVVLNATEAGERSLGPASSPDKAPVAGRTLPDLQRLLTRYFLDNCVDVFQRPNTRLYGWLKERLATRKVRGIVLWHYVGCDLWRAEAQPLRETFGLPVLLLDANEAAGDALRQSGRIEAFLESLR